MTLPKLPSRRRTTARLLAPLVASSCLLTALAAPSTPATAADPSARDGGVDARARVSLKVATTNINTYRAGSGQRAQLRRVLSLDPDVVLVQEVGDLDLAKETEKLIPGITDYVVVQRFTPRSKEFERASAVLFRRDRFGDKALRSGFALGYENIEGVSRPPARYLPWARLKDTATGQRINVVSVHMPTMADASYRRAQARMLASYKTLIGRLRGDAKLPVVVGGDYNNELYDPPASQRSVEVTRKAGLTFSWADSTAAQRRECRSTIKGSTTRRIDGIAYPRYGASLVAQRCLALTNKDDHRSVVVDLTLRTGTAR